MTYNEGITHLTNELPFLNTDEQSQLTDYLDLLENGTQTEKEDASENLVIMYPIAMWSNSEMAMDAINTVYATVNPNAPFPKIGL